jgi:hypothetical protein
MLNVSMLSGFLLSECHFLKGIPLIVILPNGLLLDVTLFGITMLSLCQVLFF